MEMQQLRYAVAIADHGTFTAAAAACHVAQPSLSHAVRKLERQLGVELFTRLGRTTSLTSAGDAFVNGARRVLAAIDRLQAEVDSVAGVVSGRLDLVALPTLAVEPLTPLVGAFRVAHPGVTVHLSHPHNKNELVRCVVAGDSELGITELPVTVADVRSHPLGRQELVAIQPRGAPRRRRLDIAELATAPLIAQPRGTSTRDALDSAFVAAGVDPTPAVETDQREAIVPLVLAGAGTAIVPRPMAVAARRQGATVIPLRPPLWRELGVIHRDTTLSPAAEAFIGLATSGRPDRHDP